MNFKNTISLFTALVIMTMVGCTTKKNHPPTLLEGATGAGTGMIVGQLIASTIPVTMAAGMIGTIIAVQFLDLSKEEVVVEVPVESAIIEKDIVLPGDYHIYTVDSRNIEAKQGVIYCHDAKVKKNSDGSEHKIQLCRDSNYWFVKGSTLSD